MGKIAHYLFCLVIFSVIFLKASNYLLWTTIAVFVWILYHRDNVQVESIDENWNMLTSKHTTQSCGWLPISIVSLLVVHLPELLSLAVSPSHFRNTYAPRIMQLSSVQQANGCLFTTPRKVMSGRCVILSQHTMFNNDICYNFLAMDRSNPYFIVVIEDLKSASVLFNSEILPSRQSQLFKDYSQYMTNIYRRLMSNSRMQCVMYPQGNPQNGAPVGQCSPFAFTLAFASASPIVVQAFIGDPGSTRRKRGLSYGVHKMIVINPKYSETAHMKTPAHRFIWPPPKADGVDLLDYHREILAHSIEMANRCCALCIAETESLWDETSFFDNHAKVHDVMGLAFEPARSGVDNWLMRLPGKDKVMQNKLKVVKDRPYQ